MGKSNITNQLSLIILLDENENTSSRLKAMQKISPFSYAYPTIIHLLRYETNAYMRDGLVEFVEACGDVELKKKLINLLKYETKELVIYDVKKCINGIQNRKYCKNIEKSTHNKKTRKKHSRKNNNNKTLMTNKKTTVKPVVINIEEVIQLSKTVG